MREYKRNAGRWTLSLALAASLGFSSFPVSFAAPGDTNSVNDGHDISGGTFFNTPEGQTTFINSANTGLHLHAGDTVVGREVSASTGLETGNGGNLHFDAHGQMVQLDGNIDVSGLLKNGAYVGNGGRVTIDAGALYQNGQIFANGINGGNVQLNVTGMTMGPGARIEARGLEGAGGTIGINATGTVTVPQGAVMDSSGLVIGTYNTNVIQVKGGIVNLDGVLQANGLTPGSAGGKVAIYATNSINIGPNGQLLANGADGFSGANPTNGGNGGNVLISAEKNLDNNGLIAANGGHGGTNPDVANGAPVTDDGNGGQQQVNIGEDGGNGGNGGQVDVYFKGQMTNSGMIEVKGGNGGKGQEAFADAPYAHQIASGGNGGAGGNGGFIQFNGNPSEAVLNNMNYQGGHGGQGGAAATQSSCGCATPGAKGACGQPGGYAVTPYTPPTPPTTPLFPPYPKEYARLGDTLPGAAGQVLSYTRSIFLARAPLPVIKKREIPPAPPVVPPAPKPVTPQPVPKKRVPVRGYW